MKTTWGSRPWRRLIVIPVGIAVGLSLVGGCGSAGDGDGSGDYSVEFRPVLLAGPATPGSGGEAASSEDTDEVAADFAALDCTEPADATAHVDAGLDQPVVACGTELGERFALGPVEIDGSMVESVTVIPEVLHDGIETDRYAIAIVLTVEGSAAFADVTQRLHRLDAPRNRLALLSGQQVLFAPSVMVPITEGEMTFSGHFTEDEAWDIAVSFGANRG